MRASEVYKREAERLRAAASGFEYKDVKQQLLEIVRLYEALARHAEAKEQQAEAAAQNQDRRSSRKPRS